MKNNGGKSNKEIWERLTSLEGKMEAAFVELTRIRNNDLVHLEKKVDNNSEKITKLEMKLVFIGGVLAALQFIAPYIIKYFLGD